MTLRHYSASPFAFDAQRTYASAPHHFKPRGLWLSVVGEADWKEWCEGEQWNLDAEIHGASSLIKPLPRASRIAAAERIC